jgi:hypothetical protein
MPIITCPKCQGKARFPEDSPPRRVKCPSCGTVYLSSDGGAASPASMPSSPKKRDSKSDFDFDDGEADDRPRRWRRDQDEEDDRRSRRREEDEPRSRRHRPRDDDDEDLRIRRRDEEDYDERPRRRRDKEDYERSRRRPDPNAIEGQFNRASLACLLNFIAGWLQVGALGLMAFIVLLDWCGVQEGLKLFAVIAGLLGLAHWLTSATGIGFLISGPRQRGGAWPVHCHGSHGRIACVACHYRRHFAILRQLRIGHARSHGGSPLGRVCISTSLLADIVVRHHWVRLALPNDD